MEYFEGKSKLYIKAILVNCLPFITSLSMWNPIPALLKQMQEDLGEKGSVIVWYETFEKGRNKEMAVMHPEYALAGLLSPSSF